MTKTRNEYTSLRYISQTLLYSRIFFKFQLNKLHQFLQDLEK